MEDKTRENYYRRWAKRLGLELKKSRGKKWSVDNQGGYMIYDPLQPNVILGTRWELTLDDVAQWFERNEEIIKFETKGINPWGDEEGDAGLICCWYCGKEVKENKTVWIDEAKDPFHEECYRAYKLLSKMNRDVFENGQDSFKK